MHIHPSFRRLQGIIIVVVLSLFLTTDSQTFARFNAITAESVDWNTTGTKLAAGYSSGRVEIIDAATGSLLQSYQLSPNIYGVVIEAAWSEHHSDLLAVATSELGSIATIHILDTATGQETLTLEELGGDTVTSIAWKPDGSIIAGAVGFDMDPRSYRYVRLWDTATGQAIKYIQYYPFQITALVWSPDGNQLVAGGTDNNITIWDEASDTFVQTLTGHTWTIKTIRWSPDGSRIASCSTVYDATIRIWDAATGANLLVIPSGAIDFSWSPDGSRIAAVDLDPEILIWDAVTGQLVDTLPQTTDVWSVAWSPDGSQLAVGGESQSVQIIPAPAIPTPTPTPLPATATANSYQFSPNPFSLALPVGSRRCPRPSSAPSPSRTRRSGEGVGGEGAPLCPRPPLCGVQERLKTII